MNNSNSYDLKLAKARGLASQLGMFAEAIEAIAKESPSGKEGSVGKELGEISLPDGATIGAIIRDNKGKIAHDHVHLRENDHVIVFLTDKKAIKQVKETFSPN